MNPLQEGAYTMGLKTPMQRFVFSTAVGVLAMYAARPATFFTEEGAPKPCAALCTGEDACRYTSLPALPWWAPPLAGGLVFAVFV